MLLFDKWEVAGALTVFTIKLGSNSLQGKLEDGRRNSDSFNSTFPFLWRAIHIKSVMNIITGIDNHIHPVLFITIVIPRI